MRIRKISILSHTYRNIHRYRQILAILFKYGFDDLIGRLYLGPYLKMGMRIISGKRSEEMKTLSTYERLRMALEELGPIFIKMGQVLSTRPDLVPVELIRELTKLQDKVPPFPFSQVKEIVEQELNASLDEIFFQFQESPIAAASIGQVHRAQLRTGEQVIVKVQRPGIRRIIESDLEILFHLATLIEKYVEEWEIHRPTRIVDEIARTLKREINYTIEASHTERFARQFIGNESIYVPRIFKQATTELILTMEYVDGIKASEIALLDEKGFDRKIIACRVNDLILEQIFKHRFFHADPHPGNVFILPGNVICYLDFGMMGHVDRQSREHFADIVLGYIRHDESSITDAILRIVEWGDEEPDRRALENDISNFIELLLYRPLKELRMENIFHGLLDLIARHRLRLPQDIFLIGKALTEVEGLGLVLYPDFDMTREAAPFIRNLIRERMHPKRLAGDFMTASGKLLHLLREIPQEFHEALKQLKQGKTKIGFQHQGLEHFISERDRSSNRIAFSLIISSLIIGSSLIIASNLGPHLFGFPLLGFLGYSMAGILGLWLLISILRSGKL